VIGAGFTVTLWLPLAMLALWLGSGLSARILGTNSGGALAEALAAAPAGTRHWALLAQSLPLMASFFLACFAAATLVSRFGGAAGVREAILGNLLGSAIVLGLAALAGGTDTVVLLAALAGLALCSLLAGWAGGALGIRLRAKQRLD
jgi:hypothetical protein